MAASRTPATSPSMVPWILIGSVIAAGAATWFGYPGLILLIAGTVAAAFSAPPTLLTGKKDINGFPTAASPGESHAMNRYRMWGELKWRLLTPSADWLPGWPIRIWWLTSLFAAAAALAIPSPELGNWWRIGNAVAIFILINTVNGALRRWTAPDDLAPGPTVDVFIQQLKQGPKHIVIAALAVVASVAVFLGTLVTVDSLALGYDLNPVTPWQLALALALTTVTGIAALAARTASLAKWRTMVRVRAEWEPRWQIAKLEPAPRLLDHDELGSIQIDTFESHPTVGSAMVMQMAAKIAMGMGAATKLALLECLSLDSQGQPVEGTKHPLRFRIVTFNTDDLPNLNDPDIDPALAELYMAAAASWLADSMGCSRWVMLGVEALHLSSEEGGEGSTGAWVAHYAQPDGPSVKWLRDEAVDEIGGTVGVESLADPKSDEVYFGGLTSGTTHFKDPSMEEHLANLALADTWAGRWKNIMKMGAIQPRPEHAVYAEAKLGSVTLYRQPFVVQQGLDPLEFHKLEPKISTTLSAAPFVSVTGFSGAGDRPGERHAQAFCVTWASQPVPSNPDRLAPTEGLAPRWILSGRMNEAFDAARLARPEIAEARPLTDRKSRGHIWEIKLRLYGGVTLADVRGNAQKLRQALGSKWLRVADAPDGCIIVAGVDPKDARGLVYARPEKKNADYVTSLDWEQAFSDAKVVGQGGVLPKLIRSEAMPTNDQVKVLDFKLPTGTDRVMVKAAVPKIQTGTGNAFVEVRPSPDGADHVRILTSREHPLPNSAGVDWDAIDASEQGLLFATGVEGEPVGFNNKRDPHILVAGASGGGKSISLQVLLYPAIVQGAEVYVIDPTKGGADFQFAEPYAKAFAATVDEAAAVMKAVYAEVLRRKNLNAQNGVGSYRDLPDDVRPNHIYVLMDEFTSLMQPDPVSKTPSDDPEVEFEREQGIAGNRKKAYIGTMAGKIAREARSAGVTLILATQKLSAKMLDDIPGAGDLKDLTLDTRIPVPVSSRFPEGWARNDELHVEDRVYTPAGCTTSIIGFSPVITDNDVFAVTFDDGQSVKAGHGHLWSAADTHGREARAQSVVTTRQMLDTLHHDGRPNWAVKGASPIDGEDQGQTPAQLAAISTGVAGGTSAVPSNLLRASARERRQVLDAIPGSRSSGSRSLICTDERIRASVTELIRSLGHVATSNGTEVQWIETADRPWRYIVAIEPIESEPTRCIAVDDESHLFLVEGFIPTHNTNLARMLMGNATFGEKQSALKNATEAPEMGDVIPPGRGLWESTEGNARLIQVWFEPSQATLAAKLAERREPLRPEEKLDLSPFMEKQPHMEDEAPKRPMAPAFPQAEPEVVTVAEFEFTLDDLDIQDGDEEAAPSLLIDDETAEPVAGLVDDDGESLDWDSVMPEAPAAKGDDLDWSTLGGDSDTAEPAPDLDAEDGPVTSVVLLAPGQQVPAGAERGALVVALPAEQTDESDLYGWWKIDAAVVAIEPHPGVNHILWVDPEMAEEDELGIPRHEIVRDVFDDAGITVEWSDGTLASTMAASAPEPATPVALARAPAPVVDAPSPVAEPESASAPAPTPAAKRPRPKARPKRKVEEASWDTFDEPAAKAPAAASVFDEEF